MYVQIGTTDHKLSHPMENVGVLVKKKISTLNYISAVEGSEDKDLWDEQREVQI